MLYLYTRFLVAEEGVTVTFTAADNVAWEHPDDFVHLQNTMPGNWTAAWGRIRELLAVFAGAPVT